MPKNGDYHTKLIEDFCICEAHSSKSRQLLNKPTHLTNSFRLDGGTRGIFHPLILWGDMLPPLWKTLSYGVNTAVTLLLSGEDAKVQTRSKPWLIVVSAR